MGIAAYRSPETVGRTFASCPPTQMSGCYHGVIQGYFLALKRDAGSVSPAVLNGVCEEHRGTTSLFFQCAHGLGHGVMALESHHLPRALARCDELTDRFVRENCYGGAFMENIVAVTHPHHTAEAHSALSGEHGGHGGAAAGGHAEHGAGEHAGHGAAAGRAAHADSAAAGHTTEHAAHSPSEHARHLAGPWRALRTDDLLYPCTVLGDRYQTQCYQMQSSAALFLASGSVRAVAEACGRAPAAHVQACYGSLGRDVSALARLKPARSIELCRDAGDAAMPACIAGVAKTFVNLAGKPADGIAFCRAVPAGAGKVECYRAVGQISRGTLPTPAEREAACATAEPDHIAACRAGAELDGPPARAETR
jgi:hypothetical protein